MPAPKTKIAYENWKKNVSRAMTGRVISDKTRKKISLLHTGKPLSETHRLSLRVPHGGNSSHRWKGNAVSYSGLHKWVEKYLGKPRICENCGKKKLQHRQYHWANISKKYKRELTDWIRLCVKCHKAYDVDKIQL